MKENENYNDSIIASGYGFLNDSDNTLKVLCLGMSYLFEADWDTVNPKDVFIFWEPSIERLKQVIFSGMNVLMAQVLDLDKYEPCPMKLIRKETGEHYVVISL